MSHRRNRWWGGFTVGALLATPAVAHGQTVEALAARLVGMTAVSGYERAMADSLLDLLPGSERDRAGNVVLRLGSGSPTRLAVCPMDEWGYVVGRLREDGWISLRRVGAGQPPLWDQMHEGHRMQVWTRNGPMPAVMAVPSTHLARGRSGIPTTPFTTDDAFLDVGASSGQDLADLGIQAVDPVTLEKSSHRYGSDLLAGVDAARRSACAALLETARAAPRMQGTVFVAFTTESKLRHRGLLTLANQHGPIAGTLLIDYPLRRPPDILGQVAALSLPSRYTGTQVETVSFGDFPDLITQIESWFIGGSR